jgi:hypothetical protein
MFPPYACGGSVPVVNAAWVVLSEHGQAVARIVTPDADCPSILIDGKASPMRLRAKAETIPQRPTASRPDYSKPASFPVNTCEYSLPANIAHASVGDISLPLPKANPRRIVIIGDSGCRMKRADNAWQDCSDPNAWPFAQIAMLAAGFKPDLVLHVGDYHYRESPCPQGMAGCEASPWGYGWDAWEADLFKPAAPLLAAAPWIMVRGNHEECARGGQGWFRFLDPRPYEVMRSCNDPAKDSNADYSDPYAVPIGGDAQVIVFDSAKAGKSPLDPANAKDAPAFAKYQAQFLTVGMLAGKPGTLSMFANHHPILGLTPKAGGSVIGGNRALLSVMKGLNGTAYYPPGIQATLHGHTHLFEAINFASDHPATFLSGNSGDNVDKSLPDPLPAASAPAEGVAIAKIAHSNSFGFLVLDRRQDAWAFKAYRRDGSLMMTCLLQQSKVNCDRSGLIK